MKRVIVLCVAIFSGCGTYVPDLSYLEDDQIYTIDVHKSIQCEIVDSIQRASVKSEELGKIRGYDGIDFDNWGVIYATTLSVVEESALNPSLNAATVPPASTVFTINAGVTLSAKATRSETAQNFVSVKRAISSKSCGGGYPNKMPLLGRDLRLSEWLVTQLSLVDTGLIPAITPKESFTYQVKFDIVRNANLNSQWTFLNRDVNRTGGIFSTGRNSSHSVLFTFGPTDASRVQLEESALAVHYARLIGDAVGRQ
jgi:hypothetical protein